MKEFQQALALLKRGQFEPARLVCNELLKSDPRNVDALHLSGLIEMQMGNPRKAAELIGRSTELDSRNPAAFFNRGAALQSCGALQEALDSYDKALAIDPAPPPQIHYKRGLALQALKRFQAAQESYSQAIKLNPEHVDAHLNRGVVLKELGQLRAALASYDRAIGINERSAEAHVNRGNVLRDLGEREAALQSYTRAISINPAIIMAYLNRGNVFAELHQFESALADYDRAIQMDPAMAEAHSNRGNALRELDRLDEALDSVNQSIALRGDFVEAYTNRGALFYRMQRVQDGLASYDQAMAIAPDDEVLHNNKALLLLLSGEMAQGWSLYESRLKKAWSLGQKDAMRIAVSHWQGTESLSGKSILLYDEQALGDTIQFCRYAPMVAELGGRVILRAQRPLIGLLESLGGVAHLVSNADPLPDFDHSCSLMSLPAAFGTTLVTVPGKVPYLKSPAGKTAEWKERLGARMRLRIGLVWSGGFRPNRPDLWTVNQRRNIPLAKLAALKDIPAKFYSLQKGQPAESDLTRLAEQGWDGPTIIDYTSQLHDFTDTAALIENLDLVIAVDTSTAHLAGALGKPVWMLNRFDTCWRWLMHRTDSPWYPTMRIYRQPTMGDWDSAIDKVRVDLRNLYESTPANELPDVSRYTRDS
jgi:tetratricopeptide (TPR) repeat protein